MEDSGILKTDEDVKKWVDGVCGIELKELSKKIKKDKKNESEE